MCRYCVEYGDGKKWYLNPANYSDELYTTDAHAMSVQMLGGVGKNSFEVGPLESLDPSTPDIHYADALSVALENVVSHGGQIVPLEDALKIIALCKGDFLLTYCMCRRYFGRRDALTCLFFWPTIDSALAQRPWESEARVLTKEQATVFEIEMDERGLLHSIWHAGVAADGIPPIVLCHCSYPDCVPTRIRTTYGVVNAQRKGEYVAVVDRGKCREGCRNYPLCMPRCNFGAMRYSPTEHVMEVVPQECFGCGLCRRACPQGALKLVERSSFPALVDAW